MPAPNDKLIAAAKAYFADIARIRGSGGATGERSAYSPLATLLNAIGATLKPKIFCVGELADQGAGHPDFGLYSAKQVQKGRRREGQTPERGVVEVKAPDDNAWFTADSHQVSRYLSRYRLVLITNTHDFVLMGIDATGGPARLETFRLAKDADDFHNRIQHPQSLAKTTGAGLGEYLARALSHRAGLAEPRDLAWLLASYARDGLARVDAAGDAPSLTAVRSALEEALGVRFEADKGRRFFHSTLVQTLFYGVFSAWVLWSRQSPRPTGPFRWREAVWHLRAPVLRALFQQLSDPARLEELNLVEVLDWTADALGRVDRGAFFARFAEGEAVPYFYEPFLEAFDPQLRKQLGVWYTPVEVVRYMVARVDRALKDDLGIAQGLAAENVYVLDPCCGTGAYLTEVLRRIAANLEGEGLGALVGARVREAATTRVFGFEIMPAPFVVAHLQMGLTMQNLDAALADSANERPGVFLTNALTGWEPKPGKRLAFPELEDERERAERVKQATPILVVLGNPPYNGFAGMAVDEERELSAAYRKVERVRPPEGQGLNDLYVRFFRMAERRIEKTGRGLVCFISNYSWLDGLSFTGMRERLSRSFDRISIDNLHGDRIISEYAPDGRTSETIFALRGQSAGIKVGTSIVLLSRSRSRESKSAVGRVWYRDFHHARADERRQALIDSLDSPSYEGYSALDPDLRLGLPFKPMAVNPSWFDWMALPDLLRASFPGVKTSRDEFLVDVDRNRLRARVADYFNPDMSHDEISRRYPAVMRDRARFNARAVREELLARGAPLESAFIRFAYRPFDNRWLYWEGETKLLDEKRAEYRPYVVDGNVWLVAQQKPRREWSPPQVITHIGCIDLMDRSATCIPVWFGHEHAGNSKHGMRPNLPESVEQWLDRLGANVEDLFHHILATLHDPEYREANAGALRMEWPRIPLPDWPNGEAEGAREELLHSANRGREIAALLDSDTPVPGVTQPPLHSDIATIAVPATLTGRNMAAEDFAVTARWGHRGQADAVMPGQGRAEERTFTTTETVAMADALPTLGNTTFDIHLNDTAYWRNVPTAVWNYRLGGYQVLKKWLSYREQPILNRPLNPEEVQHFTNTARRIAMLLLKTSRRPPA